MRNFGILLKYTLINNLGLNKLRKNKRKFLGTSAGIVCIYLLILALITFYMLSFVTILEAANSAETIFTLGVLIGSMLTFFTTFSKANVYLFKAKDYDMLMSFPMESKTIIASKLVSLYLLNLVTVFTLLFAIEIAYFMILPFQFGLAISFFVAIFFVPLLPMAFGSLLAFIFGFIPLGQKTKNIFLTIVYIALFAGFMVIYFQSAAVSPTDPEAALEQFESLNKLYFMATWVYEGITGNILSYLFFIGLSAISLVIYVVALGFNYIKLHDLFSKIAVNKNYKLDSEKSRKSKGEIKTIFQKELKVYIGIPLYIMNTIVGPLMSIIATVALCMNIEMISNSFTSEQLTNPNNMIMLIYILVLIFSVSLTTTTASTISLEGKSFWILKGAPIKTSSVFLGKSLLNIIINIPVLMINTIIAGIFIKADFVFVIGCLIIPIAYCLSTTFLGLYLNIILPKFDFDNPIKVIKQSAPVMYCILISFGLLIFIGLVGIFLAPIGLVVCLLIEIMISLIVLFLAYLLLFKNGKAKYEMLNA